MKKFRFWHIPDRNSTIEGYSNKKSFDKKISELQIPVIKVFATRFRTGDERIELPPKVLETPIIPFDQSPIYQCSVKNYQYHNLFHLIFQVYFLYPQNFMQISEFKRFVAVKAGHLDSASLHLDDFATQNSVFHLRKMVTSNASHFQCHLQANARPA